MVYTNNIFTRYTQNIVVIQNGFINDDDFKLKNFTENKAFFLKAMKVTKSVKIKVHLMYSPTLSTVNPIRNLKNQSYTCDNSYVSIKI